MTYLIEGLQTQFDEYPDKAQIINTIEEGLDAIPEPMRDVVFNYIVYGLQPGHFLTAVLTNNLKEAVHRADAINLAAIPEYVNFFHWAVPLMCWGSEEKVGEWLKRGAQLRRRESANA